MEGYSISPHIPDLASGYHVSLYGRYCRVLPFSFLAIFKILAMSFILCLETPGLLWLRKLVNCELRVLVEVLFTGILVVKLRSEVGFALNSFSGIRVQFLAGFEEVKQFFFSFG
jgi:hypothetical protein